MGVLFTAIKAVFAGFFGSLWSRFFPTKTAADEKVDVLQQEVKVQAAMAQAAAAAPTTKTAMEQLIEEHKL